MAYAGHQDAFTFQRDPEHNDAATSPVCSMLDALMHPVPLSVLALSVLVAMGFGPQLYYKASRRLLQIPVSDLQDETPPKALNEFSPKKLEQPQAQQAGKKKRAKERQKRAKEPLKEIPAKLTKSGKSSSFAQLPRKNEYQTRHQPPLHRSRTAVHNTFADESTFSGSSAAGDDDGHVDPSSTLPSTPTADEPHQTPTQKNLPISVPSFPKLSPPLPASSLTVSLLSRFAESPSSLQFAPAGPSAESPIVPSPDHDSRTLTSSPTSPSVLSGIASTTPSSLLSPQTPPVLPLPTFQSLPTNISESDELLFQDLNSHIAPDTDNLWIEGNSRAQPRYGHEAVQGTKIATSVSAPVWDSSLDWDNESNKRGSDSTLRGQSVNSSSVETLVLPEIADSPYSVSPRENNSLSLRSMTHRLPLPILISLPLMIVCLRGWTLVLFVRLLRNQKRTKKGGDWDA
ncbi:uncharacterized protein EI90DRAFT_789359 [Cantharellus anzutake]|uniref:uncharacterized protein n=1 Tax=Cantharellus anzutake TaxID=1750568 RepID=UPI0019053F2D|nr:uncharacterized protein EI90DRAFT_789359 [Cantharellus anzutake]KAF8342796.1 hypothetical protein EI90DRAFT_789359 [Cantharellus anzutake]